MIAYSSASGSTRTPSQRRPRRPRSQLAGTARVAPGAHQRPVIYQFPKAASTSPTPATASISPSSTKAEVKPHRFPLWIRLLLGMQQGSSAIAFCLATSTLIVYASTVYLQQQWSREYNQLQVLQREQRTLTALDATFENQLASQAQQPNSGLVAPSPSNTIFLPKATDEPVAPPETLSLSQPPSLAKRLPLGY